MSLNSALLHPSNLSTRANGSANSQGSHLGAGPLVNQPFRLFDLSSEIRVRIYTLYFAALCVIFKNTENTEFYSMRWARDNCWAVDDRYTKWIALDKPWSKSCALLLSSPQIFREALPVYYRNATFFFRRRWDFTEGHSRNCLKLTTGVRQQRLPNSLSPFQQIRFLCIDVGHSSDLEKPILPESNKRAALGILNILTYSMPNLKHLQLEIDVQSILFETEYMLHAWFIRALLYLRGLNDFLVCLRGRHDRLDRTLSSRIATKAHALVALTRVMRYFVIARPDKIDHLCVPGSPVSDREVQRVIGGCIVKALESHQSPRRADLASAMRNDLRRLPGAA